MITFLSLLFGFISSCLPSILKLWQDKIDKKHEYDIMELQIQASKELQEYKLQEVGMNIDLEGLKARYATFYSDNKFTNALNALVRPVFAFAFLVLYIIVNLIYYHQLKDLPPALFADLMWTEVDETIMGAVIGFYFGGRANEKMMK